MLMYSKEKNTQTGWRGIIQILFRVALGIFMVYAGISHLTFARAEFQAQVPNWVPMNKDLVVILSGMVEILLGSSLILLYKYPVIMGWILAIFFVLVFPGNIAQYINKINSFGLDTDLKRFARLFLQPVFIIWALWCTGAWKAWRKRKNIPPSTTSSDVPLRRGNVFP